MSTKAGHRGRWEGSIRERRERRVSEYPYIVNVVKGLTEINTKNKEEI